MATIGRVAFLGTGAFAVPLLARVTDLADDVLVVSQPDRPAGRGLRERQSPIAHHARAQGLELVTPRRLSDPDARDVLRRFAPDGLVLAAYGQIVPADMLSSAPREPLNVHPSLLPRHRGATPIPAAILAGDRETGVSVIVMVPQVDAGPIAGQWHLQIAERETAPELEARLAELAAERLPAVLREWAARRLTPRPQDDAAATYTSVLRRADGRIDWAQPATQIDRRVRALQPWPGAWTMVGTERLHVRDAMPADADPVAAPGTLLSERPPIVATGAGGLELRIVQPAGRGPMAAPDWLRGRRIRPVVFGDTAP